MAAVAEATGEAPPSSFPIVQSYASAMNTGNYETIQCSMPAGTVEGNMMIYFWAIDGAGKVTDPPAGWTELQTDIGHTGHTFAIGYKVAAAAEAGPYTFTATGSNEQQAIVILRITGQNAVPATAIHQESTNTGSSITPSASSVTTTTSNCLILAAYGMDKDQLSTDGQTVNVTGTGWVDNEGWELPSDTGDDADACTVGFTERNLGSAGASNAVTFDDPDESQDWSAYQVAIAP